MNRGPDCVTSNWQVELIGYISLSGSKIKSMLERGEERDIVSASGNFVVVGKNYDRKIVIITSYSGIVNYFYSLEKGNFYHACTVADILVRKNSFQEVAWNWQALGDLFMMEQTFANDTLDRGVLKTPPGSILTYADRRLDISYLIEGGVKVKRSAITAVMAPNDALRALQNEITLLAGANPSVSISGGFDSRLLLAGLLKAEFKPRMVVMGPPNGFDRSISTIIAQNLGLELEPVELEVADYLDCGAVVATATDGTKPLAHWHTYIYNRKAGLNNNDRLFIGTNGEFARTYYYDYGLSAVRAMVGRHQEDVKKFWLKKLERASPFKLDEYSELEKGLADELSERGIAERAERFAKLGYAEGHGFLDNLDKFYTTQRVGRFGGNGIRLYSLTTTPIMPLLSREWIEAVERMPRIWKLGEGWHRYAIARLYPDLLSFPDAYGESMARMAGLRYWLRRQYPKEQIPYFNYGQLFSDNRFLEMVQGLSSSLSEVLDDGLLNKIVEQQRQGQNRSRALSILFSIGLWKEQVSVLHRGGRGKGAPIPHC